MRQMVALGLLLVFWTTAVTAAAPVSITETDQREIMITVYNGNLGLVKDTRDARLEAGTMEVKFMDVAAQIDPTSVHLKSLLDGRTTIKDRQTKQLSLLAATDVPVDKHFIYHGAADYFRTQYGLPVANQKVGVYLDVKNSEGNRLGVPLPKGKVRVYKADTSGSQQLVGEDWIDHTPKDERVRIRMGDAFDVVGERVQKDWKKIGASLYEVEWEISLRNHKKEAVTVEVIEPVPGDWEVLRSTLPHEKVDAFTMRFRVPVAKDGQANLGYRLRLRF